MIRSNWAWWIVLIEFIICIIMAFIKAGGYKSEVTWDATLTERLLGMLFSLGVALLCAIALGWI